MNRILALTTLLSVFALSLSSLVGNNRYGAPHAGNSLNYRGGNRYSSGAQSSRGHQSQPYGGHGGHGPHSAQSAPRSPSYGGHHSGPGPYGGGRHFGASNAGLNHYGGPAPYGGPGPYGGQARASGPSHYSSPKRSVYQPQQSAPVSSARSGSDYSQYSQPQQPQHYSQSQQTASSKSQTSGREMKYTIRDPTNRGTTHVTETHVVSNRQMHGAEAEAAMKKLMGSMGGSDSGFGDFFKGVGLPFY